MSAAESEFVQGLGQHGGAYPARTARLPPRPSLPARTPPPAGGVRLLPAAHTARRPLTQAHGGSAGRSYGLVTDAVASPRGSPISPAAVSRICVSSAVSLKKKISITMWGSNRIWLW